MKTHLEKARFQFFMELYKRGDFCGQRLGQEFCDYFKLSKMSQSIATNAIYERDGKEAIKIINSVFDFN